MGFIFFFTNQYDCDQDKYQNYIFVFSISRGIPQSIHYLPLDVKIHFNWCKALYSLYDGLESAKRNQNLVYQNQWEMLMAVFTVEKDSLSCHNLISDNVKKPHNYHRVRRITCLIMMNIKKLMMSVYFSVAWDG